MSDAALAVDDLARAFGGVRAVDGVTFTVDPGERVALIGPNGAGKTTTFNMIGGLLRPDRGLVRISGLDVTGLAPPRIWRAGVGRTFQITATFPSMTVAENLQLALAAKAGALGALGRRLALRHRPQAEALLARVGLADQADRACAELAYGDLKRLEVAVALSNDPSLLLMDEPTAGMAADERGAMMALVDSVVRERGVAVLFTEHDMDVVFGHADRVIVIDRGRVLADGAPDAVRADAQVRAVYLGGEDGA